MENFGDQWDQYKLKNELLKGQELAKQLEIHLNVRSSSSSMASSSSSSSSFSNDGVELLVQKILCSYEKALSLLNNSNGIQTIYESPSSLNNGGSPMSEDDSLLDQTNPNSFRKLRNILPTWAQKFQVSPGMALEGSLDDGFCWRKYGQKGILGAKHPRGYYRCTHRNLQGCLATKQVQRTDDDPNVFEITYRGKHSCSQVSNFSTTTPSATTTTQEIQQQNHVDQKKVQNQQTSPDVLLDSWASLRVITDQNHLGTTHEPTLPFHPITAYASNYEATDDRVERASTTRSNVVTEFSPCGCSFLSPTISGSGLSEGFVGNQNLNLEANKCEIFTSPTNSSALNSQTTTALDFPFGEFQIDPNFTFHSTNFFS